jgi:hypothetical protein
LIRKNFSGKQPRMHPSRIAPSRKRLSRKIEHTKKLSVGSTQSMVFDADSKGPFYLEDDLLRTRKNDVVSVDTAPQTKEKTAPELKKGTTCSRGTSAKRCQEG